MSVWDAPSELRTVEITLRTLRAVSADCLSSATPPVGSTLFVGCAVGKARMEDVARALIYLYPAMIAVLILVTYAPQLTLWVPNMLMR